MGRPKGKMRSERGQKIMKEYMKEQHNRHANMMYVRSNGVANKGGRRVNPNSQPTKESPIENNISKCKDPITTKENLDALPRGHNKSKPPLGLMSNEMKQYATSKLKSKNIQDTQRGDGVHFKCETPISGSKDDWILASGTSKDQVPFKRQPNRNDGVVSPRSEWRSSSCLGKGIDEGFQRLDALSSKVMKNRKRYLEIDEDEGGGLLDKNPMDVEEVNNLNDGDQNLMDAEDHNGRDIRIGFPTKMNNEATNDRCAQSLMNFDGKTHDVKSMQETYGTLGCGSGGVDDDSEEVMRPTCGPKKKHRRILSSEDEESGVKSKMREESKEEVVSSKDYDAKVSMPFIAQCVHCCSKPIDEPVWRGTLKVDGNKYTSLVGHLSTKSCEKVWELSRSLQTSIEVMKLSGSKVRSKIWDSSKPSDDNIGLYLFPHEMRHETNLDQLINEVTENDLVLQAVVGEAEMLIFPSCLLPERYKTFRRKHYLWSLFKRREDNFYTALKPFNGTCCAQEEEKGKEQVSNQQDDVDNAEPNQEVILMRSAVPLESQRLVNFHLCMEKQASEGCARGGMDHSVNCKSPAENTQQVLASCDPCTTDTGFQLKTPEERKQVNARRHSVHVDEATTAATNSSVAFTEATAHATNAANIPANHEQFNSSMGVPPGKILFVAVKTPRVEQILQELVREGSLEFIKPAEVIGAGPGPGSITTTIHQ